MKQWLFFLFFALFCTNLIYSQTRPVEGLRDKTPNLIAFTNATIIPSPSEKIISGKLLIRGERIEALGENIKIPPAALVIDLKGAYIYPGFIDPFTNYAIAEVEEKTSEDWRSGTDFLVERRGARHWNAAVNSESKAANLLEPDKEVAKTFLEQGFTCVQTASSDGVFRGSSAIVLLKPDIPNHIILGHAPHQFISFKKGSSSQNYPSSLMGSIALIRQTLSDARWYQKAHLAIKDQIRPEVNISLSSLHPVMEKKQGVIFASNNELDLLRAAALAKEFNLKFIYKGSGYEYRRIQTIAELDSTIILPLAFPDAPNVSTREKALDVSLSKLKHWDTAPENPARLEQAKISFAFTTDGLSEKSDFLPALRKAVKRGLSKEAALKALTTIPAQICQVETEVGSLAPKKLANLVITSGDILEENSEIHSTWVAGQEFLISPPQSTTPDGNWTLSLKTPKSEKEYQNLTLSIKNSHEEIEAQLSLEKKEDGEKSVEAKKIELHDNQISLMFSGDSISWKGVQRFSGRVFSNEMKGLATLATGEEVLWQASRQKEDKATDEKKKEDKDDDGTDSSPKETIQASFKTVYPDNAFGRENLPPMPEAILIKNATIWTCSEQGVIQKGDILIRRGKIKQVGSNIPVPADAVIIDGQNRHVTPGIIDEHSHIAISGGVNEATASVTAEVRIGDVVNSNSLDIYRHLAGGVTTSHLLHGSANTIGGQLQVVKLRWGALPEEMKVNDAPKSIKFALGENVKQSNWGDDYTTRYPQTRMGVQGILRESFQAAKEYYEKWEKYQNLSPEEQQKTIPPRRDFQLEILADVLHSKCFIHCHSYVQSEILGLARLANEFGFRVGTFTHVLEGYKVARELKEAGAMASAFADWWAYKFEVYDAIPYNGAILHEQGVVTSFNSDDAEMGRRLNQEAAKAVKYGGVSEEEALKFVTLNPAKQLYLEHRIGSLEPSKDADFVIWNGHPLSVYTKVLQTWIDGRKYFDIEEDLIMREQAQEKRNTLIQKVLEGEYEFSSEENVQEEVEHYHCDDIFDAMKGN